jgi:hypothetical protein
MENLHRKEHETSATIAEAGGLAVRIRLQHPTKVVGSSPGTTSPSSMKTNVPCTNAALWLESLACTS